MAANVNRVEAALRRAVIDLDELGHPWALVGGLAVSARAEPRTTRDVDVVVDVPDDAAAEALIHALVQRGYILEAVIEQTATTRLATARLLPPGGGRTVFVDLLFASSGIEDVIAAGATVVDVVAGLTLPVASIGHLVAMKVLSVDDDERPRDRDDLRALIRESSQRDLDLARRGVDLIVTRGYHRRRDLAADLLERRTA